MRIGVIGIPGKWSSEVLADAVEKYTGFRCLIDIERVCFDMQHGTVRYNEFDLAAFDALIVKKVGLTYSPLFMDRLEILRFLHERGVRIFSDPRSIMHVLNRLTCTVTLRLGEIPLPDTVITEDAEQGVSAVEEYGSAILKPLYTSKARGMIVLDKGEGLLSRIREYQDNGNPLLYIQRRLDIDGQDLGVVFLGGEYIATYARIAHKESWNTTTHSGGKYSSYTPSDKIIEIARNAQALFNLDFTCVDIAQTPQGPVVFEVSAFGGFKGLYTACGINIAELYVDYVMKELSND